MNLFLNDPPPANRIVKIGIDALDLGMFVSRLDRPWMETPFILQGFVVNSSDDLEQIRALCNHIYVDTSRGRAPPAKDWLYGDDVDPKQQRDSTLPESEFSQLRKCHYRTTTSVEEEMATAEKSFTEIEKSYDLLLADLQKGKNLDVTTVKNGIEAMVNSVMRNPSAFMLVNQMKRTNEIGYAHALGTSVWCASFGRHLGLDREDIENLALGGMLLDVGKIKLPLALTTKKGALTSEEQELMKSHVDKSIHLMIGNPGIPHDVFRMIATHHERNDGSGYPMALEGEDIPIYGRIAGIVDSYDAMTTKSSYRKEMSSPHEAISELHRLKGKQFQTELVEQFIQTVGLYPTGSLVELSSGEIAVVIEINALRRLRPTLMVLLDPNKRPYAEFKILDLSTTEMELEVKRGLAAGSYGIKMDELFL
ncbi:MAG: HD-GYP domain-containing protein [Gammaproteobacteria bacterium]|nr:HD-GYP domain-containing protein [Gammaproteobacteria bacterium]